MAGDKRAGLSGGAIAGLAEAGVQVERVAINVEAASSSNPIQHVTVFQGAGRFAGWPANNGMWIWGNEILVGFVLADHRQRQGHTYDEATSHDKYARSGDGGLTWSIEDAREAGKTAWSYRGSDLAIRAQLRARGRHFFPPGKPDLLHQGHMWDGQSGEADKDQLNYSSIDGNPLEEIPSEGGSAEDS